VRFVSHVDAELVHPQVSDDTRCPDAITIDRPESDGEAHGAVDPGNVRPAAVLFVPVFAAHTAELHEDFGRCALGSGRVVQHNEVSRLEALPFWIDYAAWSERDDRVAADTAAAEQERLLA
jgi:hypothetical protein